MVRWTAIGALIVAFIIVVAVGDQILGARNARVFVFMPVGVVAGALFMQRRTSDPAWRKKWATERGADPQITDSALFARYLKRQRIIGITTLVVTLATLYVARDLHGGSLGVIVMPLTMVIIGAYQAAILASETTLSANDPTNNEPGDVRAASLAPRTLADYVEPGTPRALVAVAAAAVVFALAFVAVPHDNASFPIDDAGILIIALGAALLAVGTVWAQNFRMRRPQPFTTAPFMRFDDVKRSSAVRGDIYASIVAIIFAIGYEIRAIGVTSHVSALKNVLPVVGVAGGFAVGIILMLLARRAWKVTRLEPTPEAR